MERAEPWLPAPAGRHFDELATLLDAAGEAGPCRRHAGDELPADELSVDDCSRADIPD